MPAPIFCTRSCCRPWPMPSTNSASRCPASMWKTWRAMREALNRPDRSAPRGPDGKRSHVHDLDSFGAIPLESKVVRFAESRRACLPRCGRGLRAGEMAAASRGEGACRTRSGRAGAMRIGGARGELADSLRPSAPWRHSPAAAAEQPSLALQELVLTAHRSIDQHEIAFLALVFGVVLFAVVTAIMLVRARTRMARLEAWSRDEITRLRERSRSRQRARCCPNRKSSWIGRRAPTSPASKAIRRRWAYPPRTACLPSAAGSMPARRARWSTRSRRLRARGEAFAMTLTTLAGHPIEAQGRAIGGRAVLRLKDASGIKRELVDLVGRYEKQSTEVASLRALVETLPSPVWTRDAAGRLTFVNAAYARAVEAKSAADAVERRLELLDSAARESIAQARDGKRRLCRPAARRRRRRAAQLRRARYSHRDRQRRHRHRRHRSGNACAARSPASPTRIAARSINCRPASPCSAPTTG